MKEKAQLVVDTLKECLKDTEYYDVLCKYNSETDLHEACDYIHNGGFEIAIIFDEFDGGFRELNICPLSILEYKKITNCHEIYKDAKSPKEVIWDKSLEYWRNKYINK